MTKEQAIKLLRKDTSVDEIHRLKDKGLSHTEVTDKIQEACDMGVEALETIIELEKRKFTIEDLQEYMKFEDELVKKNFTFKSVIEAREKQIPKQLHRYANGTDHCPNCDANLTGMGFRFCVECGQALLD